MRNSSPPGHPPPSSALMPSPSKKLLLTSPKPKQCPPTSNFLPQNDRKTRDLPNLSDCHGCGIRINYSNPKERLQPLNSFWRIVLLCKKCIKQVNSGQICPYCFKDSGNSLSDCSKCSNCERFIHNNCIVKYGNSAPWSYSCKELGLGFSICVDCWLPELLRNSIKVSKRKKSSVNAEVEPCAAKGASSGLQKDTSVSRSLDKVVKDANCVVEKRFAVAVKAKEKALRKAVVAKNAMELASNALNLVAKMDCNGTNNAEQVRTSSNISHVSNVTRIVNDSELAFRLHRAMNSSPRISKNVCSMNLSYSDVLRTSDSTGVDFGGGDGGEDVKDGRCSDMKLNRNHDSNILESSSCIEDSRGGSPVDSGWLKPELKTYKRKDQKRKECLENGDDYYVGTFVGVAGNCTTSDDSRLASISESCRQGKFKQELHVNDFKTSSPKRCKTGFIAQDRSSNVRSDRYLLKYSKRVTGSKQSSQKEAKSIHEKTNSSCVSFENETQASTPGFPMYCSMEHSALPDFPLPSCVVDHQTCASVGVSSQEEG